MANINKTNPSPSSPSSPENYASNAEKFDALFEKVNKVTETNDRLQKENEALKASMAQTKAAQGKSQEEFIEETRRDKMRILSANGMVVTADNPGTAVNKQRGKGRYLWSYIMAPRKNQRRDPAKRINYNVIYPFRCDVAPGTNDIEQKKAVNAARNYLNGRMGEGTLLRPTDIILQCHGAVSEVPQSYIQANNNATVQYGPSIGIGPERSLSNAG
jgi:regulator of replication initiation timing